MNNKEVFEEVYSLTMKDINEHLTEFIKARKIGNDHKEGLEYGLHLGKISSLIRLALALDLIKEAVECQAMI